MTWQTKHAPALARQAAVPNTRHFNWLAPNAGHSMWLDQHPLYHLAWLLKRDTAWDVVTSRRPTIRCIAGHVERLDTMI